MTLFASAEVDIKAFMQFSLLHTSQQANQGKYCYLTQKERNCSSEEKNDLPRVA